MNFSTLDFPSQKNRSIKLKEKFVFSFKRNLVVSKSLSTIVHVNSSVPMNQDCIFQISELYNFYFKLSCFFYKRLESGLKEERDLNDYTWLYRKVWKMPEHPLSCKKTLVTKKIWIGLGVNFQAGTQRYLNVHLMSI